jgi:hypothetical protein
MVDDVQLGGERGGPRDAAVVESEPCSWRAVWRPLRKSAGSSAASRRLSNLQRETTQLTLERVPRHVTDVKYGGYWANRPARVRR